MEKIGFHLLFLLTILGFTTAAIPPTTTATTTATDFIKASCKTTLHPPICIRTLSTYASSIQGSDHRLAKAAVTVSLNQAKSAATFISKLARLSGIKPIEYQAVRDCISTMSSSVASRSQSVQELEGMARTTGQAFEWHMSNLESWVGSALTNQNICSRGFEVNGRVKDAVTRRMVYVSDVTSNALALLNRFAVRHRKGIHKQP